MHTKRRIWPRLFVSFWLILFAFGISQVFLFLQGYNPFSFLSKQEVQSGYATFSSNHSLFLNNQYLGKGSVYGRYEVGKYELCAEGLGYKSRCFSKIEVRGNDFSSAILEDIALLPNPKDFLFWTTEKVYFLPDSSALFWYDSLKKQVFWVNASSEGVASYFPHFIPEEIEYDEVKKKYGMRGEADDGEDVEEYLSFLSPSFSFLPSQFLSSEYIFEKQRLIEKDNETALFDADSYQLLSVFDEEIEQAIPVFKSRNFILVFSHSFYFFSDSFQEFQFLSEKDEGTSVVFVEDMGSVFFVKDGELWSMRVW